VRPALYYPWVYLKGGAERVLLELMRRSRHDWTLYTNHFEPAATFPELSEFRVVQLREVSVRRTIPEVARAMLTLGTQRVDFAGHDSLMVVSEGLGNFVAARSPIPTSCICLTPLKVLYDPFTRAQFYAGRRRPVFRAAFAAYRLADRRSWKRYRRVFTNSEEVRRRVLAAGLVEEDRLEVAHHGVDTERWQPDGRRERFFLVPGRIMWQKKIELALEAWQLFKPNQSDNDFRLIVAGMVDQKSRPYLQAMQAKVAGRRDVEFIVSPPDDDLLDLYQRSWAIVFPPANEDWGLVPLEAMACGKPVLATDRGGPKESVLNGSTGLLRVDQPNSFARGIRELASMSTDELDAFSLRARRRALDFPWSRFVDRIDRHLEETTGSGESSGEESAEVESTEVG